MPSSDLFSVDYARARDRFRRAAERASARLRSHGLAERGPAGEELALDVAWLGPAEPEALLAVSSGLHGVEGFAGSALQLSLLEELENRDRGPGVAVLLVHAVNPHGFAHVDRSDEDNVDLNRNFVEHPGGHRSNEDYALLADAIVPESLDDEPDARRLARLRDFADAHGFRRLEEAVAGGQYTHPGGLYYGGQRRQRSAERLLEVAREAAARADRVAWIDVHTGLGERGTVNLLSDLPPDDPALTRAARWYHGEVESLAAGDGLSVVTHGSVDVALLDALAGAREATMVTAELGTAPPAEVFRALRARGWLRHHAGLEPDHPRARSIRDSLLAAFDPRDDRWREAVLAGLHRTVERTLRGLRGPGREPGEGSRGGAGDRW